MSRSMTDVHSRFHIASLACFVAAVSYLAAKLGGALMLRPQMVWPLWPGCALIVAVLVLVPRKVWPMLIAAGLAGFVLYDLQTGLPIRSIILLILSDAIEILIATQGVSYSVEGEPRLNSLRAQSRYLFFAVILAPISNAFVGAFAFGGDYWTSWRICFFTEALALLTVTPAILSWASAGSVWAQKSRAYYFEALALIASLVPLGYIIFAASKGSSPVLLYSLVPFLLWSALRFGLIGISTSMVVVAFLSIWGTIHGRGPFTGPDPLDDVFSLQLFLLFSATPFMVLAALVEEHKKGEQAMRESEQRFRLVSNTAPVMIWMSGADKLCTYFNKPWLDFTGRDLAAELGNGWAEGVHSEDLQRCLDTYTRAFDRREDFRMEYRLRRHDGEYRWIVDMGVPRFNPDRSFAGYIGSCMDVTERKLGEEALSSVSRKLIEAQEEERTRIARDLHDDINQRLALLVIQIETLKQNPPESAREVAERMGELSKRTVEIAADVQSISHQLHSSNSNTWA
jgi:PAS domain S-box-containing protein